MSKTLPFTGSGVAIITPFDGLKTNYDELGKLIEYHIENNTDAIIICGTTGEASTMPDEEHLAAIKYTVEKAAGRITVIAGTGSNDTAHAIELSKKAEEYGVDGILSVTPYYNKTTQKGLIAHFTAIANAIKIPVILYNVPSRTGMSFAIDVKDLPCMKYVDVMVDGEFVDGLKDNKLLWRGSTNQKVIDVQKSLEIDKVVLAVK